jgi:hypothetical protein
VAAITWRPNADVDSNVEDRADSDPHQLCLRHWRRLEMQAAQHTFGGGVGVVLLDEPNIDPVLDQHILAKDLGKKPARIAMTNRRDDFHVGNFGADDLHAALLSV